MLDAPRAYLPACSLCTYPPLKPYNPTSPRISTPSQTLRRLGDLAECGRRHGCISNPKFEADGPHDWPRPGVAACAWHTRTGAHEQPAAHHRRHHAKYLPFQAHNGRARRRGLYSADAYGWLRHRQSQVRHRLTSRAQPARVPQARRAAHRHCTGRCGVQTPTLSIHFRSHDLGWPLAGAVGRRSVVTAYSAVW